MYETGLGQSHRFRACVVRRYAPVPLGITAWKITTCAGAAAQEASTGLRSQTLNVLYVRKKVISAHQGAPFRQNNFHAQQEGGLSGLSSNQKTSAHCAQKASGLTSWDLPPTSSANYAQMESIVTRPARTQFMVARPAQKEPS